jgi:hypothetical protein
LAVDPNIQMTQRDSSPHGDEVHIPLQRNPYNDPLANPQDAADYENGYQHAQDLGHQGLAMIDQAKAQSLMRQPAAWKQGMADAARKLGKADIADMLEQVTGSEAMNKISAIVWEPAKEAGVTGGVIGGLLGGYAGVGPGYAMGRQHIGGRHGGEIGGAISGLGTGVLSGLAGHYMEEGIRGQNAAGEESAPSQGPVAAHLVMGGDPGNPQMHVVPHDPNHPILSQWAAEADQASAGGQQPPVHHISELTGGPKVASRIMEPAKEARMAPAPAGSIPGGTAALTAASALKRPNIKAAPATHLLYDHEIAPQAMGQLFKNTPIGPNAQALAKIGSAEHAGQALVTFLSNH